LIYGDYFCDRNGASATDCKIFLFSVSVLKWFE
jgi:hypothetical protein